MLYNFYEAKNPHVKIDSFLFSWLLQFAFVAQGQTEWAGPRILTSGAQVYSLLIATTQVQHCNSICQRVG